jgi:hypothetical protein
MPDLSRRPRRGRGTAALLGLLFCSSTLALADPTPRSRWSWTPLGYGFGGRGFSALDVDGDGRAELFAVPRENDYWYELRRDGLFRQSWTSFLDELNLVDLDAADTPSGARVAVLFENKLRIFDARLKSGLLEIPAGSWYNTAVALGDVDLDGVLDAVVCDDDDLYLYELDGGTESAVRPGFSCSEVKIGQIDADPQLEIVLGGNPAGGYVLDGVTLAVEWGDLEGFGPSFALGDLDGDGRDEILAASDFESIARALDPETDSELWSFDAGNYGRPKLLVADVDGSSGVEAIVFGPSSGLSLHVGSTGELLRTPLLQSYSVSAMAAADSDGDGDVELLWSSEECCSWGVSFWLLENGSNVAQIAARDALALAGGFAPNDFGGGLGREMAIGMRIAEPGLASAQVIFLDARTGSESRRSQFDESSAMEDLSTMEAVQGDEDAPLELVLGYSGSNGPLRSLDGPTLEDEWIGGTLGYVLDLAVAELDGDSDPEIVAGTGGPAIEAHEAESGWLKWQTPELDDNPDAMDRVLAIDVDADGSDEILGRLATYYYTAGPLALFSGATGDLLGGPWDLGVSAMARPELEVDPPHPVYVTVADEIRALDPLTGTLTAALATLAGTSRELGVVDLDRDGTLDFIVVDAGMHLQVVDGAKGTVTWTGPFLGPAGYAWPGLSLQAGDLDGNGVPDFAVASRYGLFYFEGPVFGLLLDGFESGDTDAWSASVP